MKDYYQKHKEQLLKKQSDYYIENKEKIKSYMKKRIFQMFQKILLERMLKLKVSIDWYLLPKNVLILKNNKSFIKLLI